MRTREFIEKAAETKTLLDFDLLLEQYLCSRVTRSNTMPTIKSIVYSDIKLLMQVVTPAQE